MRPGGFICGFLFAFLVSAPVHAEVNAPGADTVAVYVMPQTAMQLKAVSEISHRKVIDAFERCGRFMPVEINRMTAIMEKIPAAAGEDEYRKSALDLGAGLCVLIGFQMIGNACYASMKIIPLRDDAGYMKKNITVKGMVAMNIPLKLVREIFLAHEKVPVYANITDKKGNICQINAGQWHGLSAGEYRTEKNGSVQILKTGRYASTVVISDPVKEGDRIVIKSYPELKEISSSLEKNIELNILYKYGLSYTNLAQVDAEKRFITGICVINTGASFCAPGYGSYLSTEYLRITPGEPSAAGISLTCASVFAQFTLPEFITGFSINFFPWIRDNDKTDRLQNLQIFLWATIPLTFAASYMDQLAYQFSQKSHLPPFFENKNEAAAAMSLFIPGGGLFYKGYRAAGWAYYFAEMAAASYAVYHWKENAGKYALIGLGVCKIAEMINAYFISPAYPFYRFEKEEPASFSLGLRQWSERECIYSMNVTLSF